jgi:hypothetical protein
MKKTEIKKLSGINKYICLYGDYFKTPREFQKRRLRFEFKKECDKRARECNNKWEQMLKVANETRDYTECIDFVEQLGIFDSEYMDTLPKTIFTDGEKYFLNLSRTYRVFEVIDFCDIYFEKIYSKGLNYWDYKKGIKEVAK